MMKNDNTFPPEAQALLAEYSASKAELASLRQSEAALVTATFSFIAAIIGLNIFFSADAQPVLSAGFQISRQSSQAMLLGISPLLAMYFGCLWIDSMYQRYRYESYLYLLESDISRYIPDPSLRIYWEHWKLEQHTGRGFFRKTNRFYGYMIFGTWVFAPALIYPFMHLLFPHWQLLWPEWQIFSFIQAHPFWCAVLLLFFLIYWTIVIFYCTEILELKKPEALKPRVPDSKSG